MTLNDSLRDWLGKDKDKLPTILKEHGYETHPGGMTPLIAPNEIVLSLGGKAAYVDVVPEAVRINGKKPKRAIRVEFERMTGTAGSPWAVTSAQELEPGVPSLAPDRDPHRPIDEPWPK